VLGWYAMRWSIEQTFQDAEQPLGFEPRTTWREAVLSGPKPASGQVVRGARPAVERTAPVAMLLYSLIVLWFAAEGHRHDRAPPRPGYRSKSCASFADMLRTLRCQSLRAQVLSLGLRGRGLRNVLKNHPQHRPTGPHKRESRT